jgi:hypothetical protein
MRLDARLGDTGWKVFDSKRCCEVGYVEWCDDVTAQWGSAITGCAYQEDRITIHRDKMLVVFNEVPDQETETRSVQLVQQGG